MVFTLSLGGKAIDFELPAADGKDYTLEDFTHKALALFPWTYLRDESQDIARTYGALWPPTSMF